jgi:hypothetical protein
MKSMKFAAHVASIVFALWYLMAPPKTVRDGKTLAGLDMSAPLSSWQVSFTFNNHDDCEKARAGLVKLGERLLKDAPSDAPTRVDNRPETSRWSAGYGHLYGQCIASDDPRLKESK